MIVLTTFELDEYVFGALRAGAAGFLLKDMEPTDVVDAVRVVAAGEALLAPRLTRRVIEAFASGAGPPDTAPLEELTPREREVLTLVGQGLTQRGDRRAAGALPLDREDACGEAVHEARRA